MYRGFLVNHKYLSTNSILLRTHLLDDSDVHNSCKEPHEFIYLSTLMNTPKFNTFVGIFLEILKICQNTYLFLIKDVNV